MTFDKKPVRALCFDYGNTLIEFGPRAFAHQYDKLEEMLTGLFGHCDPLRLKDIRDRQIRAPFENGYRENDIRAITEELIYALYHCTPSRQQVDALIQVRYEAFLHSVALPDGVFSLLARLRDRYRLGLVSNYPCSRSICDSLHRIGLHDLFDDVVVSGDCGYVKPHPKPFEIILSRLSVSPSEAVYIGDNWLADIQGAKKMGMQAILITQHESYESFEPSPGDYLPDARIEHLNELETLLTN
jgi:putative hydrolase of the HAD superfamily